MHAKTPMMNGILKFPIKTGSVTVPYQAILEPQTKGKQYD